MMRKLVARLRVPAGRCVLVEDTLIHQKAARRVGMGTVWMQRFARHAPPVDGSATRWATQPAYVDRRVRTLAALRRRG